MSQIRSHCEARINGFLTQTLRVSIRQTPATLPARPFAVMHEGISFVIGMTLRTVRFQGTSPVSTLGVLSPGYHLKMAGVLTTAVGTFDALKAALICVVAGVVNNHTFRDGAISEFISKPAGNLPEERGVAIVCKTGKPGPALRRPTLVNFRPITLLRG